MVLAQDGATWFLSAIPGAAPEVIAPWPATVATLLTGMDRDVLLFLKQDDVGRLVRVNEGRPGVFAQDVSLDGVVQQMAVDDSGDTLALWIRNNTEEHVEWRAMGRLEEAGTVIAEGALHLSRRAFQAGGGGIALVSDVAAGTGQAIVQSRYNLDDRRMLGEASEVAWRPGADELILMAPDHAGRRQLWRVSVAQPDGRTQITFLDSGLGETFCIADDGAYAVANVPDSNRFVIVAL